MTGTGSECGLHTRPLMDYSAVSNYKVVAFVFMGETESGDHVLTQQTVTRGGITLTFRFYIVARAVKSWCRREVFEKSSTSSELHAVLMAAKLNTWGGWSPGVGEGLLAPELGGGGRFADGRRNKWALRWEVKRAQRQTAGEPSGPKHEDGWAPVVPLGPAEHVHGGIFSCWY